MNKMYKRADLLGISVYDFVNNYHLITDSNGLLYGVASCKDIDNYYISHNEHVDFIKIIDLKHDINNLKVLQYNLLEKILEGKID